MCAFSYTEPHTMKSSKSARQVERLGYTVSDALAAGAFPNRNKLYGAIARGDIASWKDGRSRMISADSLREYVARKASEQAA